MDMDTENDGLTFRLDAGEKALFASIAPSAAATPINEAWLHQRLVDAGYGDLECRPEAVTTLLHQYNNGMRVDDIRLAECVDAHYTISVSPDQMQASLDITPARGGDPVTLDQVMAELDELGVQVGVLSDVIEQTVAAGSAVGVVIARGLAPVAGEDGYLETLLPDVRDRRPHLTESGTIDYHDLGNVTVAHPGERLMRRHPSTAGTNGITVKGDCVPAHAGKDMMFAPNLSGVAAAPDDPDILVAAISGQPVQVKGGVIVEPVYTVETVNMATGNVVFDGSVKVRGDVCTGMTIEATGDIEIEGVVEPATLEAGGSIVIKGGAMGSLGRKEGAHHLIRCGGSLSAGYLQQIKAVAGDSIFVDDMVMQCDLTAVRHIRVGKTKRGHIVGGRLQATYSITAKVLGSPNRVATLCEIGLDPALNEQLHKLGKQRGTKEMQLVEISKLLAYAKQHPNKVAPEMLQRAKASMKALYGEIEVLRAEEDEISRKLQLAQQSRVTAEEAMYDGLTVQSGSLKYTVRGEHGAGAIAITEHGLGLVPTEAPDDATDR
ncbi:MAG: DUF342 domain-containing protein [Rhodocyclales bacterium]|nr:DUF342 domain-containing protein [Rhodocyclales bacterium]